MKNERELLADLVNAYDTETGRELFNVIEHTISDAKLYWHMNNNTAVECMTNREYWLMTCVFVYLHGGDVCGNQAPGACKHCEFIETHWPMQKYNQHDNEEYTNDSSNHHRTGR